MSRVTPSRLPACAAAACLLSGPAQAAPDNPAAALEAPRVEVVGTSPLPTLGLPKSKVPANVQILQGADMGSTRASDVTDFFNHNAGSITLNSAQGNPFQPDVNFRGFTASHLLGLPQGLSVFQDGVRVNEAFGDTVNWDLIPQSAISSITLMPGSNPQFGLNTLGGSLAINTKSGFQYPGFTASAQTGSFGRRLGSFEWGGHGDKVDWFLTANSLSEDGWRDYSPSRMRNLFGKVGYQDGVTDFDLSLTLANNTLEGTQALPQSFLGNRRQPYTWPDRTTNKVAMLNARLSHFLSDKTLFSGNVYARRKKQDSFASNVNDGCEDAPADCLLPPSDPAKAAQGSNETSALTQNSYGSTVQLSLLDDLAGMGNQLTMGASADISGTDYAQFEQDADFDASRGTGIALSGFSQNTRVRGTTRYYGVYLTDTLSLTDTLALTASGRFNRADVQVADRSGLNPAVNGNHTFTRFNPALGVTWNPTATYTTYANYSEGMRAPTPVELTCADPNAPCPLPNAFLADPPLNPVISRTMEVGARGSLLEGRSFWNAALFRTNLRDDIQFIAASSANSQLGYFDNIGNTRREGFELGMGVNAGRLRLSGNYTFLRATFLTPFDINSPNNPAAQDLNGDGDANEIRVTRGKRMPNIPTHALKLRADYAVSDDLSLGGNLLLNSGIFARGDENNVNGRVPGYALVNLDARYRLDRSWSLFARMNNVFDRRYENFAILGENFFPGGIYNPGAAFSEPFYGVGAPRGFWVGVRYDMGRPTGGASRD